jgi:hypothetical protein
MNGTVIILYTLKAFLSKSFFSFREFEIAQHHLLLGAE